ncbi:hypothetical protein WJX77_002157 [Trebouxia sp. C0004]
MTIRNSRSLSVRLLTAAGLQGGSRVVSDISCPTQLTCLRGFASEAQGTRRAIRGPVNFASLGLTGITAAGLVYYYQHIKEQKKDATRTLSAGKAAIGGPFDLADGDGNTFTEKDLLGEFALLYFGFTFCPDICPDELEKMAKAVNSLEQAGKSIQPVFISIDPERDSPKQVKQYVKEFHPKMLGLTGTIKQVKDAAKAYRVYFTKTDESKDYLVDHSIIMYLIDPKGDFVSFYGKNYTADQLATAIGSQIEKWKA